YVKLNTRGHDSVARGGKRLVGAAFERFTDCVEDIRTAIALAGLMLLGPVADVAAETKQLGRRELARRVAVAARIARRDPDALVPRAFGVWSARRYLSLYRPGGVEDVFPYYRPGARWTALRRV